MHFRLVHVLAASAAFAALPETAHGAPQALCPVPSPRAVAATHLDDGAWSYFGDPRALAHGDRVFIGCVSRSGEVVIHQVDRKTGRTVKVIVHRNPEVDDHDNPSLVFWRGHMWAFYSPHSGRYYPLNRKSEMHYRASRRLYNIKAGLGPEHHVRTNTPGGLGYTYPNPVAGKDKLWLFWRGGNWYPTFSYTKDGFRWVKARTLVVSHRDQRPYAKYVGGRDESIHMVMSDAHPMSHRTSLYYVRYKAGRFYRANGRRIGTMRDLPLRIGQIDRVYGFTAARGRGWPHDIALDAAGRPLILYTGRIGGPKGADTFYLARWSGRSWRHHRIVAAGKGAPTFTSGGGAFDHADPSRLVLSRRIGKWFQIELWRTADHGLSWLEPVQITDDDDGHSFRPVIPRGFVDPAGLFVAYVHGTAKSFRSYETDIEIEHSSGD